MIFSRKEATAIAEPAQAVVSEATATTVNADIEAPNDGGNEDGPADLRFLRLSGADRVEYAAPGAPELAQRVKELIGTSQPLAEDPDRGLDHGAYVPMAAMYADADVPLMGHHSQGCLNGGSTVPAQKEL